jgi:DNA-binding NarL/FixJ family response regulator
MMSMGKIKVLLADDHQVVRQGMRALINAQPDIEVIGEAADGHELVRLAWSLQPDVVISDIAMPNLNGIEAAGQIHKRFPKVRVIMLSMHSASSYVIRALRGGALGYVLKDDDIEVVLQAIRTVHKGSRFLSPQVFGEVLDTFLSGEDVTTSLEERLTEREREILQLVGESNTNQQIAEKLNISPRTVEKHRANLMLKLKLKSHADVIRFAIQQGVASLRE